LGGVKEGGVHMSAQDALLIEKITSHEADLVAIYKEIYPVLTYMGEAGVDRFHIARVLNHRSVTHDTVTAIYDRYVVEAFVRVAPAFAALSAQQSAAESIPA
jgi:hypothetical protein